VANPTYPGPTDGVLVRLPDDTHEFVERGQELKAKVPASFQKQLVAQGWTPGKKSSTKPRAPKAAPKTNAAKPQASPAGPAAATTEGGQ